MTTMLLKNLIDNLDPKFSTLKIKGISFDTRSIKKDDLFISIKGNRFDGDNYINQVEEYVLTFAYGIELGIY